MGMEYTIRFDYPNAAAVLSMLERLPMARQRSSNSMEFELRSSVASEAMPDACLTVEPTGLYYCDYGGRGRDYLGLVMVSLVNEFGLVTIEGRE